jgi:YVTN family beta-propeller protein
MPMPIPQPLARYDRVAVALHWLVAVAVLAQLTLGWWMLDLPKDPPGLRAGWFNLHKSIGLTVLLVVVARLAWRWRHRPPAWPTPLPPWQRHAASLAHKLMYACLLALPLSGLLGSNFTQYPVRYFGIELPRLLAPWPAGKEAMSALHAASAWLLMVLIAVHVAAVLWHLTRRDGMLQRMAWRSTPLLLPLAAGVGAMAIAAVVVAQTPERAYVSNEKSGTVGVIDTAEHKVVASWPAGGAPRGMSLSRDGRRLWVTDQAANALHEIDTRDGKTLRTIALGASPEGLSLSPDGTMLAAASELANAVVLVDARAGTVVATVPTQGKNPEHAVFSPDGRWLFASAEDASQVDIVDVSARRQVAQVEVGRRPRGIAFTPDGTRAYVACELDHTVYGIDVARREVVARVRAGEFANGLAMHPSGSELYVSNGRAANVSVIDLQRHEVIATMDVGQRPWNMALSVDGATLYVANGRSDTVSVLDTAARRKRADIPVGSRPWGVVMR